MSASSKDFQVVRFKANKNSFEILTKIGSVLKYRDGKLGLDNVMVSDDIFTNYHKADKAKSSDLHGAFGTTDIPECIKIILRDGELQYTTEERKEMVDKKRAEIVNYIHKYYVDPRSKTPHPVTRVENAIDAMKVHVDPFLSTDRQLQDILKKLPDHLPVKKCEIEALLKVPHKHMGSVGGLISKFVRVERENFTNEGCEMNIAVVPGDYDKFISEISKVTKNDYDLEVVGAEGMMASSEDTDLKKGKGKAKAKGAAKKGGKRNK